MGYTVYPPGRPPTFGGISWYCHYGVSVGEGYGGGMDVHIEPVFSGARGASPIVPCRFEVDVDFRWAPTTPSNPGDIPSFVATCESLTR